MKTVQIDCILELNFEGDLTREELIKAAYETLNTMSDKEICEKLQIDDDEDWHIMNEDGEEMEMDLIEKCVTVEELKSYVDSHCRAGISCEEENGNPWCINHASPELRDEFASKYGCICGSHCERCCNFKECHPNGLNK